MLRAPSLRAPFDILFPISVVALTAGALVWHIRHPFVAAGSQAEVELKPALP